MDLAQTGTEEAIKELIRMSDGGSRTSPAYGRRRWYSISETCLTPAAYYNLDDQLTAVDALAETRLPQALEYLRSLIPTKQEVQEYEPGNYGGSSGDYGGQIQYPTGSSHLETVSAASGQLRTELEKENSPALHRIQAAIHKLESVLSIGAFLKVLNEKNEECSGGNHRRFKRILYERSLDAYALSCGDFVGNAFSGSQDVITYYVTAVGFQPHLETLMVQGNVDFTVAAVLHEFHTRDDYNYPEDTLNASSTSIQDGQIKAHLALDQEKRFKTYDIQFIASSNEPYVRYPSATPALFRVFRDMEEVRQRLK